MAAELIREKVFRLCGEEIPYAVAVSIDKFEEEGNLRRIFATILVDRDSHKAIIIGKGGEKLKTISTQARLDMERAFDSKVYLEVWVKVEGRLGRRRAHAEIAGAGLKIFIREGREEDAKKTKTIKDECFAHGAILHFRWFYLRAPSRPSRIKKHVF